MIRTLAGLMCFLICLPTIHAGSETDYKKEFEALKARVLKLENELKELRNQLKELKSGKEPSEPNTEPKFAVSRELKITIQPGPWNAGPADLRVVCLSAAKELWKHCPDRKLAAMRVKHTKGPPMVLFNRGPEGEYRVLLNVGGQFWAQCAYQFGHEFCHILCNYRGAKNPNLWFEESLCETASLFVMRSMAKTWKTNPPYSNWKSYSLALQDYADKRMNRFKVAEGKTLADWYRDNKEVLRKTATDRNRNQIVAEAVLPLLEANPKHWQAVGFLNQGKADPDASFEDYLRDWYKRTPVEHKPFVANVAGLFDIKVKSDSSRNP